MAVRKMGSLRLHNVVAFAGIIVALNTGVAFAQTSSDRPLSIYGGYAAGGNTDVALRALAEAAGRISGRRVLVDTKAGASGTLAAASVIAGRTDGSVIAQIPITVFRMPHMGATYDPRTDLSWIIGIAGYRFGTTVRGDSSWKTWKDFIDYARANPGKITYGTPGSATSLHITMEDIAEREGIKWVPVAYKGGGPSTLALLANEINAVSSTPHWEYVKSGQFRVLAVWTEQRNPRVPNTPTLKELGYNIVVNSPWGLAGPKGMVPATVKMLHDLFKKAMDDPEFLKVIDRLDQDAYYMSSEQYLKFAREAYDQEKAVVQRFNLK